MLTETHIVHSVDGTAHAVVVTIMGTDDAPELHVHSQSVVEGGARIKGQVYDTDADSGDQQVYGASKAPGFTFHPDGSYEFDPTHPAYNHLAAGQTQIVSITVAGADSQGAMDLKTM